MQRPFELTGRFAAVRRSRSESAISNTEWPALKCKCRLGLKQTVSGMDFRRLLCGSTRPHSGGRRFCAYGGATRTGTRGRNRSDRPWRGSAAKCCNPPCLIIYSTDLLVLGWVGTFVYDSREAAGPTIHLFEYANTQRWWLFC